MRTALFQPCTSASCKLLQYVWSLYEKGRLTMNVTKHGKIEMKLIDAEDFKCGNCGCEFYADEGEYYVEKGTCFTTSSTLTYTYCTNVTDTYVCSCPECHKIVTKTKQRTISNPTITLSGTSVSSKDNIPDACKSCSNHPSNGGSGICNCTLGSPHVTCSSGG